MTHSEFFELAKDRKWVVGYCHTGQKCWCRIIRCDPPIYEFDDVEMNVVGSGTISKEMAEYIVNLHNQNLKQNGKI